MPCTRPRRDRRSLAALTIVALALTACGSSDPEPAATADAEDPATTAADTAELDTIDPGVLKVAIQPYAPYTSGSGGSMEGLDADILSAIADRLGLEVEVTVTDFPGMLASVQSRRVDITIGGVAWTEERQQQGLFTDPPYYSPPAMAVREGAGTFSTVEDLEGLHLGTVEGYVWVESIKAVPGATLHAYPDGNGVFDDLRAERIDIGFLDPLLIIAAEQERDDLNIETQYLTPPTDEQVAEHPEYDFFRPYMTAFYLPQEATALEAAITAEIRAMYESGEMAELLESYGADVDQFLEPAPEFADVRRGVDRPDDWEPPSI